MINTGKYGNNEFFEECNVLKAGFNRHIEKINHFPAALKELVFDKLFYNGEHYLYFPLFFRRALGNLAVPFMNRLCISGYFYFRYLLCVDGLLDNDVKEGDKHFVPASTMVLKGHICHEESIRLLCSLFPPASPFWNSWKKRSKEFFNGILIDKSYDLNMDFSKYHTLSAAKCSFLKAAVDGVFYKSTNKDRKLFNALMISIDHLSAGRCLQDDLEDFRKDLIHKKNNYGHVLLNEWMKKNGQDTATHTPEILEKYFFTSRVAEDLLEKSKSCFNLAIEAVAAYRHLLPEYIHYLEAFRNKSIQFKVTIEAYRVSKIIKEIKVSVLYKHKSLPVSIAQASNFIKKMQHPEGSWQDVSNKQGLSNVWTTGYIAMQLAPADPAFKKAAHFLHENKQFGLWAYNKDWVPDFDSATCSLSVLSKARFELEPFIHTWFEGQAHTGGFSTYKPGDELLTSYLGIENKICVDAWSKEHTCVSALAYYFLSGLKKNDLYEQKMKNLKAFLLKKVNEDGVWEPYWWTSVIYPSAYIIKGMLNENKLSDRPILLRAMASLVKGQCADGSFKCDLLAIKNVFYTALMLDLLCQDKELFSIYRKQTEKAKNWLLGKQYKDGCFEHSNFMVLPFLSKESKKTGREYKIDGASGSGSITGEIAGLFSTVSAYKALTQYQSLISA